MGHSKKVLFNAGEDIQDGLRIYKPGRLLFAAGAGGIEVWDLCTSTLAGLIQGPQGLKGTTQLIVPNVPGYGTMYVLSENTLWSMDLDMPDTSLCAGLASVLRSRG